MVHCGGRPILEPEVAGPAAVEAGEEAISMELGLEGAVKEDWRECSESGTS